MSEGLMTERLPWEIERDRALALESEGRTKEAIAHWCDALSVAFDARVDEWLRALIVQRS